MYIEEKLIQERIITRDHIDELYNIFVLICDNTRFKLIPLDFTKIFQSLALSKQLSVDPNVWSQYFVQIDYDKDGRVDFQDFLRYTTQNIKLIIGQLGYKSGINTLKSLNNPSAKKCFNYFLSNFFLKILNVINPFALSASARTLMPGYINYTSYIRKGGDFPQRDMNAVLFQFSQMINSINSKDVIVNIISLLSSSNGDLVLEGMTTLNKLFKPLQYISSHFELLCFINPLIEGLKLMGLNGLLEKLLSFFNITLYTDFEKRLMHLLLKIVLRIIHMSNYLFELDDYFSKEPYASYTKENSIDVKNFKEFIDKTLIRIFLSKLKDLLSYNSELFHITSLLVLAISKRGIQFLSLIFTESNYLEMLLLKIETTVGIIDKKIKEKELKKLLYYCLIITEQIIICKDFNTTNLTVISAIIEKFSLVASVLQEHFFLLDDIDLMNLYLYLLSMLALKGNFNDKLFILKCVEMKQMANQSIINAFFFYCKNLLMNPNKQSIINIISELKVLNLFYSYSKLNELFISDLYDFIELIITHHNTGLMSSSIIRDILMLFSEEFNANSNNCLLIRKIVGLLAQIGKMNDIIINEIILDSDIPSKVIQAMELFVIEDQIYSEYYLVNKTLFNTIFIDNSIHFLLSLINSDVSKCTYKFIRHFNINNLQYITKVFSMIFSLWDDNNSNNNNKDKDMNKDKDSISNKQIQSLINDKDDNKLFNKFKDLPKENVLCNFAAIFELLDYYLTEGINFNMKLKETIEKYDNTLSLDHIVSFIKESFKQMRDKVLQLNLSNPNKASHQSMGLPLLTIYTQNVKESQQAIWTKFDFPTESLTYDDVVSCIEKSYDCELEFYVFNDEEKIFTRIKNENDFIANVTILLKNKQSIIENKNVIYLYLLLNEKPKKTKIIGQCMNCNKSIEIETPKNNTFINHQDDSSKLFCEECKQYFFSKIANQIGINKTYTTPSRINPNLSSITPLSLNNTTLFSSAQSNKAMPYKVLSKTTFIDK